MGTSSGPARSEEHTSELQSHVNLVCRLLLEKKKARNYHYLKVRDRATFELALVSAALALETIGGIVQDIRFSACGVGAFFFNDTATTEIYTLSLHGALPISFRRSGRPPSASRRSCCAARWRAPGRRN